MTGLFRGCFSWIKVIWNLDFPFPTVWMNVVDIRQRKKWSDEFNIGNVLKQGNFINYWRILLLLII